MDIDEIGYNDTQALLCHTDGVECCADGGNDSNDSIAQVNWYSPDGSIIVESDVGGSGMLTSDNNIIKISNQSFAVSRGEGVVRLFQSQSTVNPMDLGRFCCMLPGAEHMACVNICKWLAILILHVVTVDFSNYYSGHRYD